MILRLSTRRLAGHILGCVQFIVFVQLRGDDEDESPRARLENTYIERGGMRDGSGFELYLASVCHAILQLTVISAGLESPRARLTATLTLTVRPRNYISQREPAVQSP